MSESIPFLYWLTTIVLEFEIWSQLINKQRFQLISSSSSSSSCGCNIFRAKVPFIPHRFMACIHILLDCHLFFLFFCFLFLNFPGSLINLYKAQKYKWADTTIYVTWSCRICNCDIYIFFFFLSSRRCLYHRTLISKSKIVERWVKKKEKENWKSIWHFH